MTVIIRREGVAFTWTCKKMVPKGDRIDFCNHVDTAESEQAAKREYGKHVKTARGH